MTNISRLIVRHSNDDVLADSAAHRLLYALTDIQAARGEASVVLTGGTIGTKVLKTLTTIRARETVDWSRINFWWSDERFVPKNSPDRNALQAQEACLFHLPVNSERVHPMPSTDDFATVREASERYSQQLLTEGAAKDDGEEETTELKTGIFSRLPKFDILLLGVGPDSHIASLFPGKTDITVTDALTVPVMNSPKPPPERISLTLPAINTAEEIWFIVSGADKAEAVARATSTHADITSCPASGASGKKKTIWLLDQDAASLLPKETKT